YTCLFWADYGSENYDATNLKSVALKDDATNMEAYFAKQNITIEDGATIDVTLHRAVAKMVLKETDMLQPGSLKVTYAGFKGFNVSDGVGVNQQTFSQTISIENVIEATTDEPAEVGSFLMLANADERELQGFKVQYQTATKTEPEKTITNVPVQANYVTNINGKYSVNVAQQFTIIVDDAWATPENEYDMIPYVTFSAESEQTFTMDFGYLEGLFFAPDDVECFEYSVGGGEWTRFTTTVSDIHFGGALGDLRLRGKSSRGTAYSSSEFSTISFGTSGVLVDCTGDIRTLIDYENYKSANTENARFSGLFKNNTLLKTAPELPAKKLADDCYIFMFAGCTSLTSTPELSATELSYYCYANMFEGCTSLTTAPELSSTTLADACYMFMFKGCTSLTTAPELRATALLHSCYYGMFQDCTSLTTAPKLPATTIVDNCYACMFKGCTSLTTAPELRATALLHSCYYGMFQDCTSLTTAPKLPATTIVDNCYACMFKGCTSLTTAPELPAKTLAKGCYYDMFQDCTSLTTAPELPAKTLEDWCYSNMFNGCKKLSKVTMLATKVSSLICLSNWLTDSGTDASSRTLTLANTQAYTDVESYLPDNWKQGAEGTTVNFEN
ncbi:MAG: leucine-rich repeat protein, partial [Candidatus Limisoma sp.]